MADSASELESDCSSIDGTSAKAQIPASKEQLQKRIESIHQECKVLKVELETYKLRCKNLLEENKNLRKASVTIQAKAEQEEEFISNMLLKKIQVLKKEKEALAMNYEQEEEFLTNDLSRKLSQLKQEKVHLEKTLEHEQEIQVNKLLRKIRKLEAETTSKQADLEQLRREKIELENTLEQEQESLVNRLWKRMEKLEAEKRILQEKLDQPVSEPPSPQPPSQNTENARSEAAILSRHVQQLKTEVARLKRQLTVARTNHYEKMEQYNREEMNLRHESQSIKKKYMEDVALTRTLSESESSVDMEDDKSMDQSPHALSTNPTYPSTPRANRNAPSPSILANRSVSPMNVCVSPNVSNQYKSPQHLCTNCGFTLLCTASFNQFENPPTITRCKRSPSAEIFAKPPLPPPPTLYTHSFDVPTSSPGANIAVPIQLAKGQLGSGLKKEAASKVDSTLQGEGNQAKRKESNSIRRTKDNVTENTNSASL